MLVKKMFDFMKKPQENTEEITDFTELPDVVESRDQVKVVIEKLDSYIDSDRILRKAKSGSIVIAKMKDLKEKNIDELKNAINKIKTSTSMFKGDVVGVSDEWVIITPPSVEIKRND
jgi:SepF-like predicted cell division protein (DUF552 family)